MTTARETEAAAATAGAAGSQTLSRGLLALELLADAGRPLTIAELAEGLGVHRSNAYRILRTLEQHRFATRDHSGRIRLGPKLTVLARGVAPALHEAAMPAVTELAYELGMTAFVEVLDGDEAVTLVTVEPSNVTATIARNPGVRHPVSRGAAGHAIESSLSPAEHAAMLGDLEFSEGALRAGREGYAISSDEVINGVTGIALPMRIDGEPPAAVAVVNFNLPDPVDRVVEALRRARWRITHTYR